MMRKMPRHCPVSERRPIQLSAYSERDGGGAARGSDISLQIGGRTGSNSKSDDSLLDRYFPEFTQVFPSFWKMALAVLEYTPFPSDLAGKELEEVLSLYRQSEGLPSPQRPKAKKLIELAQHSIGVTEGQQMAVSKSPPLSADIASGKKKSRH